MLKKAKLITLSEIRLKKDEQLQRLESSKDKKD